ncbi:MAG: ribonuclease HII [Patescibacteria group bacterium]
MARFTLQEEKKLWKKGFKRVVGLDEAGRGPLAGPVVAAAVTLNTKYKITDAKIRDSKKLTVKQREHFFKVFISQRSVQWGVGRVSEKLIDKINIKNAAELAMEKALLNLEKKMSKNADFLIIDGNHLSNPKLKSIKYKLIVKADEKVFSCTAAGIIAKVWRDMIMQGLHLKYPKYRFDKHKGYPTKFHIKTLQKYGECAIHRNSFQYHGSPKTKAHQIKKK